LAFVPGDANNLITSASLSHAVGGEVTAVAGFDNNLTLCVEAEGLSLPHIAAEFVDHRRDRIEFAGRVHCRNDISWTPLIAAGAAATSGPWGGEEAIETESQQVMCKTLVM
jgi:hypothetical protein